MRSWLLLAVVSGVLLVASSSLAQDKEKVCEEINWAYFPEFQSECVARQRRIVEEHYDCNCGWRVKVWRCHVERSNGELYWVLSSSWLNPSCFAVNREWKCDRCSRQRVEERCVGYRCCVVENTAAGTAIHSCYYGRTPSCE